MPSDSVLVGACGLYCGACYHYREAQPEGQHLLEDAKRRGRSLAGYGCDGCRSARLYVHADCAQCKIRGCVEARTLLHCGLCVLFPCERILEFQHDGRLHHRDVHSQLEALADLGIEDWLAVQSLRWRCTCGMAHSWYEETCSVCGACLVSYGPDPTIAIQRSQ